jgi:hypothetical protein
MKNNATVVAHLHRSYFLYYLFPKNVWCRFIRLPFLGFPFPLIVRHFFLRVCSIGCHYNFLLIVWLCCLGLLSIIITCHLLTIFHFQPCQRWALALRGTGWRWWGLQFWKRNEIKERIPGSKAYWQSFEAFVEIMSPFHIEEFERRATFQIFTWGLEIS